MLLLEIKAKILVVIEWSYRSSQMMLIIEPRMVTVF